MNAQALSIARNQMDLEDILNSLRFIGSDLLALAKEAEDNDQKDDYFVKVDTLFEVMSYISITHHAIGETHQ